MRKSPRVLRQEQKCFNNGFPMAMSKKSGFEHSQGIGIIGTVGIEFTGSKLKTKSLLFIARDISIYLNINEIRWEKKYFP